MHTEVPQWQELLETARWAPSPHNTQPWKVAIRSEREADLFLDPSRTLPDEDTTGSFIRCSMGMFIECLAIVASHRSCLLRVTAPPAAMPPGPPPFARLELEGGASPDELTPADILGRRTSRLPARAAAPEDDLRALAAIAAGGDQSFGWTNDAFSLDALMDANMDAMIHDLNNRPYHDEIVKWFRYGARHAARTRDGLASTCMNMPAYELYLTAKMPGLLTLPVVGPVVRALYSRRVGAVRQMGFLSGPFFEPADAAARAGRVFMRLWLHMHRRGISIHPFGNLVTNAAAHRALTPHTGRDDTWLVFRLGRTASAPRSHRLPVESILCSAP